MMRSFPEVRMNMVGIAGVIVSFIAGQALAASNVTYLLELGGNNHASSYKAGSRQYFTPGYTEDHPNGPNAQIYGANSTISWGVRLNAGGVQQNGNGAGSAIEGVANFVFDLELHQGSAGGPLVTNPPNVFKSTINDGQNGDVLAAAAFAFSFNLQSAGPGRVVDQKSGVAPPKGYLGGPLCGGVDASADFLKSATYPTAEPGKLVGMGAGYNAWLAFGSGATTKGIGMNITPGITSNMVICQGELDLTGLPEGTYVLVVKTGSPAAPLAGPLGTNVLRGDLPGGLGANQNSFATAADTTTGDTLTFVIGNPVAGKATTPVPAHESIVASNPVNLCWTAGVFATSHDVYFGTTTNPPLVSAGQVTTCYDAGSLVNGTYYWRVDEKNIDNLVTTGDLWSFTVEVIEDLLITEWRSIRNHPGAGDLALLMSASSVSSEPRQGGIRKIQVDVNQYSEIQGVPTIVGSNSVTYFPAYQMIDDDTLELTLPSALPDEVCYTIDLAGILISFGGEPSGDTDCVIRNLYGDANPMSVGSVNLSDTLCVKAREGTSVSASPWGDVNVDGAISSADTMAVKSQAGHSVCP